MEGAAPTLGPIWANARDLASQNACLIGGGYFIHARFRPTDRSPPIWGSRGRELNLDSPTKRSTPSDLVRSCIQLTFLPPSMTPACRLLGIHRRQPPPVDVVDERSYGRTYLGAGRYGGGGWSKQTDLEDLNWRTGRRST